MNVDIYAVIGGKLNEPVDLRQGQPAQPWLRSGNWSVDLPAGSEYRPVVTHRLSRAPSPGTSARSAIAFNLLFPKLPDSRPPLWDRVLTAAAVDMLTIPAFADPLHVLPVRSFDFVKGILLNLSNRRHCRWDSYASQHISRVRLGYTRSGINKTYALPSTPSRHRWTGWAVSYLQQLLGHSPGVAAIFALALLSSGQSASLIATVSGQIVSEGFPHGASRPHPLRGGGCVVLFIVLPSIIFPLIWLTSSRTVMRVRVRASAPPMLAERSDSAEEEQGVAEDEYLNSSNDWVTAELGYVIWALVVVRMAMYFKLSLLSLAKEVRTTGSTFGERKPRSVGA
ncbi:hypothetical protein BJV78DRAFT_1351861 [Lactifluus subvellereus]|nr:hypothetical protein BJV78DRAFT_1351861 [Lactifluus subvellereus]